MNRSVDEAPAEVTVPYLSQAAVMRLVKPTYVGSHRRPDSVDPSDALFEALVRRDTLRAVVLHRIELTTHAADEDES